MVLFGSMVTSEKPWEAVKSHGSHGFYCILSPSPDFMRSCGHANGPYGVPMGYLWVKSPFAVAKIVKILWGIFVGTTLHGDLHLGKSRSAWKDRLTDQKVEKKWPHRYGASVVSVTEFTALLGYKCFTLYPIPSVMPHTRFPPHPNVSGHSVNSIPSLSYRPFFAVSVPCVLLLESKTGLLAFERKYCGKLTSIAA